MAAPDLWIEAHRYGARVLARDAEPWLAVVELGLFYRQLADLLRPDLIEVPLLPVMRTALLDECAAIVDSADAADCIAGRLAAPAFLQVLHDGANAIAGAGLRCTPAFALPGPQALVESFAPHATGAVDDDALDVLADALTEVARTLTRVLLPRLILHESSATALKACDVLLNLMQDYRIPVALVTDDAAASAPVGADCVMPAAASAVAWRATQGARALSERLWESPEAVDPREWRDASIVRLALPPRAAPELVMQALQRLRPTH